MEYPGKDPTSPLPPSPGPHQKNTPFKLAKKAHYDAAYSITPKLKKGLSRFLKLAIDCFFEKGYFSVYIETS
jgi:hypothetical protein